MDSDLEHVQLNTEEQGVKDAGLDSVWISGQGPAVGLAASLHGHAVGVVVSDDGFELCELLVPNGASEVTNVDVGVLDGAMEEDEGEQEGEHA